MNTRAATVNRGEIVSRAYVGIGQIRRHIGDANLAGNN